VRRHNWAARRGIHERIQVGAHRADLCRPSRAHRRHPPALAAARPTRPPTPVRPLARAAAWSGGCLVIAAVAVWEAFVLDPGGPGLNPYHSWAKPFLVVALAAVLAAFAILPIGVATSLRFSQQG
jgi:apolipoprotein N-acyltransferase